MSEQLSAEKRLECTGCHDINPGWVARQICGNFWGESDGDPENRMSEYCARCGHTLECHEPVEDGEDYDLM